MGPVPVHVPPTLTFRLEPGTHSYSSQTSRATETVVVCRVRDDRFLPMRMAPADTSTWQPASKTGSPILLTKSISTAIGGVNPQLDLTLRPLVGQINASLTQERLIALLAGFFGALALLLAGLGLYGVTSYAVTRRRIEIGIRMALGAAPTGVVRLILSRVAILVGSGVAIGAIAGLWASKFVASLLYGLEPHDPLTFVGSAITLGAIGAVAGWLPAWHASRIDPAAVLRES